MYEGPIIDCDVHHARQSDEELLEYLPEAWREYVRGRGRAGLVPLTAESPGFYNPHGIHRDDAFPAGGAPPGSDIDDIRTQVLERPGTRRAVLTFNEDLDVAALNNPYYAAEVARALNDWTLDKWLSRDERLMGSILAANQLPDLAAKEIRRLGSHPRMAQVLMASNGIGYALGHPLFHPIYEAASEVNIPIALHAGGAGGVNPSPTAGGAVSTYLEFHMLWPQALMTHLVSFIVHGVFERFPGLRLLLMECGLSWVPGFLWRFDAEYKGLRREVPWLKRLPSEYFQDHVWLTSQPLELSAERHQLTELLSWFDAPSKVVFASDYPHWDTDERRYISQRLPKDWHRRIFYENALQLYGWESDPMMAEPGAVRAD